MIHAAVMEGASFNDDEIKRIEDAVAKFQATVEKIGDHMQNMGTNFTKMPNPLPGVANELLSTMSALKQHRDDHARRMKSVNQLQADAAQLKQKYEDKNKSLQGRDDDLLVRERELEAKIVSQDALSASLTERKNVLDAQDATHATASKAHHEHVGQVNAEKVSLKEREARTLAKETEQALKEKDLAKREKDLAASTARQEALSSSLEGSKREHNAQVAAHAEAVQAHYVKVGEMNAEKASVQKRKDRVLKREADLASREQELTNETVRQQTLVDAFETRYSEFMSDVEAHSRAVQAHDENVGRDKVHREEVAKTDGLLKGWETKLEAWQARLNVKHEQQQRLSSDQDERQIYLDSAQDEHIKRDEELDKRSSALSTRTKELDAQSKKLDTQFQELEARSEELDERGETARELDVGIRNMAVYKLQTMSTHMDLIGPVVQGLVGGLDNLSSARTVAAGISSDIGSIRAKTTSLDRETSSLTDKLNSLSLETTTAAAAAKQHNVVVGDLLSKLDSVQAKVNKLDVEVGAVDMSKIKRLMKDLADELTHHSSHVDQVTGKMNSMMPSVDGSLALVDYLITDLGLLQPCADETVALVKELMTDLELLRPLVPHLFDRVSRARFDEALQSAPLGGQPPMSSQALTSEFTQAQNAVALQAQAAAGPAQETAAVATAPQTPVVSPQQKRKLGSAHSGSHKRHTSSQGQASHPDSVSSETDEPLGESFGEPLSAAVSRGEEQTQSEAVAEPSQAISQPVVAPAQGALENIWSKLMFAQNWATEDQDKLRKDLERFQAGAVAYRPLAMFEKISKRQLGAEELCWISQSMKVKGDFTENGHGRACKSCVRFERLCLRIEYAPPQSGKSYRVTVRPT